LDEDDVVVAAAELLWDFGDTLVDERWMRTPPVGCPTWEAAWLEVMAHSADRWNLGAVTSTKIFDALSVRTGMAREQVEAHARRCCEQLVFNETAWRVAKERWLPQALVTVNPDLFTDHIVPVHGLTAVFDVIVVSSAEGTDDKSELCDRALTRLGYSGPRSAALLIDNRRDLVNAWIDTGGAGYLFHSDQQFHTDLPNLLGAAVPSNVRSAAAGSVRWKP
jgi:phosphoglycolate phosphatase-like HAD superfamily hydrolase